MLQSFITISNIALQVVDIMRVTLDILMDSVCALQNCWLIRTVMTWKPSLTRSRSANHSWAVSESTSALF